jgi:hypothetical protein
MTRPEKCSLEMTLLTFGQDVHALIVIVFQMPLPEANEVNLGDRKNSCLFRQL